MAAFFTAIYPGYVTLTKFLFTETVFTFLLVLSVFLFLKARSLKSMVLAVLLGLTLGFLSLTRSTAVALPVIYAALFFPGISKENIRRALYISAIVGMVYIMVLAPWVSRNIAVHGRPVLISTNGGLNFYQAVTPKDGKIFGLVPSDENIERSRRIANEAERDVFLFSRGVEKIAHNPILAARLALMRGLFYWGFFDWEVQTGREYNYLYGFALPFFIAGLIIGLRDIKGFGILPAVIAYFSFVILASQGTVRYRLPTDGCLFIAASCGILYVIERVKNKFLAISGVSAYFALNYYMFMKSGAIKELVKNIMAHMGLW